MADIIYLFMLSDTSCHVRLSFLLRYEKAAPTWSFLNHTSYIAWRVDLNNYLTCYERYNIQLLIIKLILQLISQYIIRKIDLILLIVCQKMDSASHFGFIYDLELAQYNVDRSSNIQG
jgi:hypothetical protein